MTVEPSAPASEDDAQRKAKSKPRGRVVVIRERCKGCGYCVAFCPVGALEMSPEFNVKGYHFPRLVSGRDCTGCDLCGMYCPDFAVSGSRQAAVPVGTNDCKGCEE